MKPTTKTAVRIRRETVREFGRFKDGTVEARGSGVQHL
tara:strand:- start:559 stop:672 length:114 start_codon:yes stop_codon:yes gene_type:complete